MPTARRGMVLPLVMACMMLVLCIAGTLQAVSWRAGRGARTQWDAQRALYAAEYMVVQSIAEWPADSVAATPIGESALRVERDADGWTARRAITRTAPLVAVVYADARAPRAGTSTDPLSDRISVARRVTRIVRLEPPAIAIPAAVAVLGAVQIDGATISGRDRSGPAVRDRDDCGPLRDTASVDAVQAIVLNSTSSSIVTGSLTTITSPMADARTRAFDDAWRQIDQRAARRTLPATGIVPTNAPWRASVIAGAGAITLEGASRVVGLLAIDGDLVVRGTLRVDGVLVVRGALDASIGALDVDGAVVVRDSWSRGSRLGSQTVIRYAPCLVGRALAAVALPRVGPFDSWNSP